MTSVMLAMLSACERRPEAASFRDMEAAVRCRDTAAILQALPARPGLDRWLERQGADTRLTFEGKFFHLGGVEGALGARVYADPGRWSDDRWPLGPLVFTDRVVDVRGDGPLGVRGKVRFDRARATLTGDVWLEGAAPRGVLVFALGADGGVVLEDVLQEGRAVPWDHSGPRYVVAARAGTPVELRYRVRFPETGYDLVRPEVLLLSRDAWLPTPLASEVDTALDLRLSGLGDLELRGGAGLSREGTEWRLVGRGLEHDELVGRPSWSLLRTEAPGLVVEVATDPGGGTDASEMADRVAEAVAALGALGPLPSTIRISEIPSARVEGGARAPHAVLGGHVVMPVGYLRQNPLGLAHEVVHLLYGVHSHPAEGLPSVEEPVAELLSLRAARTPEEALRMRQRWQHRVEVREGDEGRPLVDAYRTFSAQYSRGALVLQALQDRIGEAALLGLLLPLDARTTGGWSAFADAVAASDHATGAWLRTLLEAPDLPDPSVRLADSGAAFVVVDAGDTGLPASIDVQVEGDASEVLARHRVDLRHPEPVLLPAGASSVVLDPEARAPIRGRREDTHWIVPR